MELIGNFTFILQDNSTYSAGWLDDSANRIASVIELLVFKMSLADAIDAPRFFVDEREDITIEILLLQTLLQTYRTEAISPNV